MNILSDYFISNKSVSSIYMCTFFRKFYQNNSFTDIYNNIYLIIIAYIYIHSSQLYVLSLFLKGFIMVFTF